MDELKNGLPMDRLSCHRFRANFWRLLLHTAACNLLNAVRDHEDIPDELRRVRTGSAPIILSTLRNIALNLLNGNAVKNKAAALRRHAAHPYEALALIRNKDDF